MANGGTGSRAVWVELPGSAVVPRLARRAAGATWMTATTERQANSQTRGTSRHQAEEAHPNEAIHPATTPDDLGEDNTIEEQGMKDAHNGTGAFGGFRT